MKLTHITLTNFVGINGTITYPCKDTTLFCGPNGSGKSRIADAISFALLGQLCRGVTKKKDLELLISGNQRKASVSIELDTLSVDRTLPDNHSTMSGDGTILHNKFLPYCLDIHKFSAMPESERREFLMRLTGVRTDTDSIKKRMLAMSCDPDKTDMVAPMVRAGFEQAETSAKDEARQEKANWRAVTGRTWSVNNGEDWTPDPIEDVDLGYPAGEHEAKIVAANDKIQSLMAKHAEMSAVLKLQSNPYFDPKTMASIAREIETLEKTVADEKESHAKYAQENKELCDSIQTINNQLQEFITACPSCGEPLDISVPNDGIGFAVEKCDEPAYPREAAPLIAERGTLEANAKETSSTALDHHQKEVAAMFGLSSKKQRLQNITKQRDEIMALCKDENEEVSEDGVQNLTSRIENGRKYKADMESHYREWELAEGHKLRRDEKVKKAAAHHTNVMQWLHIADALSSSGIPSQLVLDALGSVNKDLQRDSDQTGFEQVSIEPDMSIRYGYRPYQMLSESEKWRVDMICTAVIAKLSGINIVVLDRLDILDLTSRGLVMRWLSEQHGEMQSIVMATLKAPIPNREWMVSHWLGDK